MRKEREISDPTSCFNRAGSDEWIFVLLGRDVAAPVAIRAWARERIRCGKNGYNDAQIQEALHAARVMEGELDLNSSNAKPTAVARMAPYNCFRKIRRDLEKNEPGTSNAKSMAEPNPPEVTEK